MTTLKGLPLYDMQIQDELDGVYKISLVNAPAIQSDFILFSEDEKKKFYFKDEDKHIITGPCMIPQIPIYRVDDTGFEYYVQFSEETIRKSAELFMKNGFQSNISVDHRFDVEGAYEHAVEVTEKIRAEEPDTVVIPVSVMMGRGMKEAQNQIVQLVSRQEKRIEAEEKGTDVFGSSFMQSRAVIDDDDDGVQYPGSEN